VQANALDYVFDLLLEVSEGKGEVPLAEVIINSSMPCEDTMQALNMWEELKIITFTGENQVLSEAHLDF
jgi:hypothetical protein